MNTPNLTENEIAVLIALNNNHYGDHGSRVIWDWAVNDSFKPTTLTGKSLAGVIGSLAKKGLVSCAEYDVNEGTISINSEVEALADRLEAAQ